MNLKEAINASQIWAARGYTDEGKCVVSVAYYGDELRWLTGWDGNWAKHWEAVDDEGMKKLEALTFKPSGPKPEEQIEQEVVEAITEIVEDEDEFEPMGETYE